MSPSNHDTASPEHIFSGNIYIFHAFDVGDEINLDAVENSDKIITRSYNVPKFIKKYHTPAFG